MIQFETQYCASLAGWQILRRVHVARTVSSQECSQYIRTTQPNSCNDRMYILQRLSVTVVVIHANTGHTILRPSKQQQAGIVYRRLFLAIISFGAETGNEIPVHLIRPRVMRIGSAI